MPMTPHKLQRLMQAHRDDLLREAAQRRTYEAWRAGRRSDTAERHRRTLAAVMAAALRPLRAMLRLLPGRAARPRSASDLPAGSAARNPADERPLSREPNRA